MSEIRREKTACFTGHRPEKLSEHKDRIKERLNAAIDAAIEEGYDTFITGLARGVDLWAGEMVLEKKKTNPSLSLIAAKPFDVFSVDWKEYSYIIENADEVFTATCNAEDTQSDEAYTTRDRWMVDNSSLVLAVYCGAEGGTKSTIEYANNMGVPVRYI